MYSLGRGASRPCARLNERGHRKWRIDRALARGAAGAELAEVDVAAVRREKVEEPLVVGGRHPEHLQDSTIVPAGFEERLPDDGHDVRSRDIAIDEQRVNVLPERTTARGESFVQMIGDALAPFA